MVTSTEELVFVTSDAQLLHFRADKGQSRRGAPPAAWPGSSSATGARAIWFGAVDPGDEPVVVAIAETRIDRGSVDQGDAVRRIPGQGPRDRWGALPSVSARRGPCSCSRGNGTWPGRRHRAALPARSPPTTPRRVEHAARRAHRRGRPRVHAAGADPDRGRYRTAPLSPMGDMAPSREQPGAGRPDELFDLPAPAPRPRAGRPHRLRAELLATTSCRPATNSLLGWRRCHRPYAHRPPATCRSSPARWRCTVGDPLVALSNGRLNTR